MQTSKTDLMEDQKWEQRNEKGLKLGWELVGY